MTKPFIDAHHHLWRYVPTEQPWMTAEMQVLQRDFLPRDLDVMKAAGVTGTVLVEQARTLEESLWLAETAEAEDLIRGIVGWVPLTDPDVDQHLALLKCWSKVKGVRYAIQDESDDQFILREDFGRGVSQLLEFGLAYDILIFEKHLPQTLEFVDRHPNQRFILDHIGKPRIREGLLSPWKERISELALRENTYCKMSGLVTEAGWKNWTAQDLSPYLEVVLRAFGPARLMFGSDWPVLTLASTYDEWGIIVREATKTLSSTEQEWIFWRTAQQAYGLDSPSFDVHQ